LDARAVVRARASLYFTQSVTSAKYPLPDKRCDRVFDELRAPLVVKAAGKPID
jgi:hypothetical protein